ncbi:MAG TPA: glycoside hydrolase family 43 protein [Fibrobacteria bacterium]|nr:glycoside hydrolase family 43 protein [Fibrobacteria bacterium]
MPAQAQQAGLTSIKNGGNTLDDGGVHVDAHGGNVLLDPKSGKYHWFGEYRGTPRGVGCYSSQDLYNWKKERIAMTAEEAGLVGMVFERPKVVYNALTNKYVMWYHHDTKNYGAAELGVAVSDNVAGPYIMIRHFRPNGHESRDFGIFTDDDGKVYVFYSSKGNSEIRVVELTPDFQNVTTRDAVTGSHCEGEGIMKYNGIYYLIASGCAGWTPNPGTYATATDIMGPWTQRGNPMIDDVNRNMFASQPTFILKVQGYEKGYLYMGDRWNGGGSTRSQYIWLPIVIPRDNVMELRYQAEWNLSVFGAVSIMGAKGRLRETTPAGWIIGQGVPLFTSGSTSYNPLGRQRLSPNMRFLPLPARHFPEGKK